MKQMLTEAQKQQIQDAEIPDGLDMVATTTVAQDKDADALGIDETVWNEAFTWSDVRNIIQAGKHDYHLPEIGPWKQDVGIDFTPKVRETGEVVFHARMFKATITPHETTNHRDQPLATATIGWNPRTALTKEFVTEFLRHNHPENQPTDSSVTSEHLTVIDVIRLLHNFPGDTPVIIQANEMGVHRPLGSESADVALITAPDPGTPGMNNHLRRVRVGEPLPAGHHQVCAIGLYNSAGG